jgi:deoxyadenosine/deoxycytidine kinase
MTTRGDDGPVRDGIVEIDRSAERRAGRGRRRAKTRARRYLAVSGNMGSGKSSLVEFLCRRYGLAPLFEPNDENPYLADFYRDMPRFSFASQIYFLAAKLRMHLELESPRKDVIQDRTIWEDAEIFAENLHRQRIMNARDYATYRLLYEAVRDRLRPPDLMIYLRCSVRAVRKRIAVRGREIERRVPTAYLRRLGELYERWIGDYRLSPLVIIPTDRLDYVTDLVDCHELLSTIEKYLA